MRGEKAWNSIHKRPRCYCGELTTFISFKQGYRQYCSPECYRKSPMTIFNRRSSMNNPWWNDAWKAETADKMRLAHFHKTLKKLEDLRACGFECLDQLDPLAGQQVVLRFKHFCGLISSHSLVRPKSIKCSCSSKTSVKAETSRK